MHDARNVQVEPGSARARVASVTSTTPHTKRVLWCVFREWTHTLCLFACMLTQAHWHIGTHTYVDVIRKHTCTRTNTCAHRLLHIRASVLRYISTRGQRSTHATQLKRWQQWSHTPPPNCVHNHNTHIHTRTHSRTHWSTLLWMQFFFAGQGRPTHHTYTHIHTHTTPCSK